MPLQLIYTSNPSGLIPGRSGFCTVARSETMPDSLAIRLEQLSYYEHLALSGHSERLVLSCRSLAFRGSVIHVLSRILDAGLDFTRRTNFLAHHLAFSPDELAQIPLAPTILKHWSGWRNTWAENPQLLKNEDWGNLYSLPQLTLPARHWEAVSTHPSNAVALLDQIPLNIQAEMASDSELLDLLTETLLLLEARHPYPDCLSAAWNYTFTTRLQDQDALADFQWRFLTGVYGGHSRIMAARYPVVRLGEIQAASCTTDEDVLATRGCQPPRIICQSGNQSVFVDDDVRLSVEAEGISRPLGCQWVAIRPDRSEENLPGENAFELRVKSEVPGAFAYYAVVSNRHGYAVRSAVIEVRIDKQQPKIVIATPKLSQPTTSKQPILKKRISISLPAAEFTVRPTPEPPQDSSDYLFSVRNIVYLALLFICLVLIARNLLPKPIKPVVTKDVIAEIQKKYIILLCNSDNTNSFNSEESIIINRILLPGSNIVCFDSRYSNKVFGIYVNNNLNISNENDLITISSSGVKIREEVKKAFYINLAITNKYSDSCTILFWPYSEFKAELIEDHIEINTNDYYSVQLLCDLEKRLPATKFGFVSVSKSLTNVLFVDESEISNKYIIKTNKYLELITKHTNLVHLLINIKTENERNTKRPINKYTNMWDEVDYICAAVVRDNLQPYGFKTNKYAAIERALKDISEFKKFSDGKLKSVSNELYISILGCSNLYSLRTNPSSLANALPIITSYRPTINDMDCYFYCSNAISGNMKLLVISNK